MPRRISATVSEAINRSSSRCAAIQPSSGSEGCGFTTLLMISCREDSVSQVDLSPLFTWAREVESGPHQSERRRAVRMPPDLGGSPVTAVFMAARTCSACPSSARRRASDRIKSRSNLSAMISKRVKPRCVRRAR